jgi:hypothetical protein
MKLVEHRRDKIAVNKAYMLCYVTMNETKHACYIEIEIF